MGQKSFLDKQLGQALKWVEDAQDALDAKVQEVTLFMEENVEIPLDTQEEDSFNTIVNEVEKDLSNYKTKTMDAIQEFERLYRLELTNPLPTLHNALLLHSKLNELEFSHCFDPFIITHGSDLFT